MKIATRRRKGLKVISQRGRGSSQAKSQSRDMAHPAFNYEGQTYLTVPETRDLLRLPSDHAVYMWAIRHRIPKCRVGRSIRFLRRDLDEAVQPEDRKPIQRLRAVHGGQQ